MKSPQGPDLPRLFLIASVTLMAFALLLRVYPPLAFMGFLIGCVGGFFFLGDRFRVWIMGKQSAGGDRYAAGDTEFSRRVAERLADCREREERFRDEGERILKSISTLRDDLSRNANSSSEEVDRAQQVIKELEAEFSLRHAKASFFADCAERLRVLLDRHRLVESIAARRRELRDLRQSNFDDEAAVEETRFSIEQDSIELDTIVELSNSAVASNKTEQTEDLRDRLERLRATLGKTGNQESKAS